MKRSWPNFEVLSQNLPQVTEENQKTSVTMVGLRGEILIRNLLNIEQKSVKQTAAKKGTQRLDGKRFKT
jgi:hypothetical protein